MEIGGLIGIILWIVVLGLIFWLLWWAVQQAPEPFKKVATVLLIVAAALTLIYLLIGILPPMPHYAIPPPHR